MGSQDKNLRQVAIPYYGQIMTYNRSEQSDQDPTIAINPGDLTEFTYNSGNKNIMVRILRPLFAQIVEAYLNISLTFDTSEASPYFYISCGSGFAIGGLAPLFPSMDYIKQAHYEITGQVAPYGGVPGQPITQYKLNLTNLIPDESSASYSPDMFVVGIHFLQPPAITGIFHLNRFFITGSALVTP